MLVALLCICEGNGVDVYVVVGLQLWLLLVLLMYLM